MGIFGCAKAFMIAQGLTFRPCARLLSLDPISRDPVIRRIVRLIAGDTFGVRGDICAGKSPMSVI